MAALPLSMFRLLLVSITLCAQLATAAPSRYTITYGKTPWVCMAVIEVNIPARPSTVPPSISLVEEPTTLRPRCWHAEEAQELRAPMLYPPVGRFEVGIKEKKTKHLHDTRQFDLWLDQQAFKVNNGGASEDPNQPSTSASKPTMDEIPSLYPKVTLVTDKAGREKGVCNKVRGALGLYRQDGDVIKDRKPPTHCASGAAFKVGMYLACHAKCDHPEHL